MRGRARRGRVRELVMTGTLPLASKTAVGRRRGPEKASLGMTVRGDDLLRQQPTDRGCKFEICSEACDLQGTGGVGARSWACR